MQEDTGLELVSLVRIEDENFSRDVIGRETGYAEQYMGMTKDGTICLVGLRPDNKFELNLISLERELQEQTNNQENVVKVV